MNFEKKFNLGCTVCLKGKNQRFLKVFQTNWLVERRKNFKKLWHKPFPHIIYCTFFFHFSLLLRLCIVLFHTKGSDQMKVDDTTFTTSLFGFYSMAPPCCFYPPACLISVQWLPHFSYCCIKAVNTGCMHSLADQKIQRCYSAAPHSSLNLKKNRTQIFSRSGTKLSYITSSFQVFCCCILPT
jgi:hypothetical protein